MKKTFFVSFSDLPGTGSRKLTIESQILGTTVACLYPNSLFYCLAVWVISLSPALLLLKLLMSGSSLISPSEVKVAQDSTLEYSDLLETNDFKWFFPALDLKPGSRKTGV